MEKQPKWLWGAALGVSLLIVGLTASLAYKPPEISPEAVRYHIARQRRR